MQGLEEEKAEWGHAAVMGEEVVSLLKPIPGMRFLDGTVGAGGHCLRLMQAASGDLRILAVDRDVRALEKAGRRLAPFGEKVHLFHGLYSDFPVFMRELGWDGLDGILLDLGFSSIQLDDAQRGFSFCLDGPLDMRMNSAEGEAPAWQFVNRASEARIREVLYKLGEEPLGGRIAREIARSRVKKTIDSTLELAELVSRAYPAKRRALARNHPATRTFQAIRIHVNRELDILDEFLCRFSDYLNPGGRIGIISFHSLEDRPVKQAFRTLAAGCTCPKTYPQCVCGKKPVLEIITRKPLTPGDEEIAANPRSASAKFRVARRLP